MSDDEHRRVLTRYHRHCMDNQRVTQSVRLFLVSIVHCFHNQLDKIRHVYDLASNISLNIND
jgi:hypothetical protein